MQKSRMNNLKYAVASGLSQDTINHFAIVSFTYMHFKKGYRTASC